MLAPLLGQSASIALHLFSPSHAPSRSNRTHALPFTAHPNPTLKNG
ncbi:hypothetical protein [Rubrivirga sp.]